MTKFLKQTGNAYKFYRDKNAQKKFNNELVQKTGYYQNKFGFETNPRKGHEFWNVEADAFKHTFGSTKLYLKYGNVWSTAFDIGHEYQTPHNPQGEWNMDSWNNNQGREIAKEILKEYGDKFMNLSQQQRDDIIAVKVMDRMRNRQLITNPNDKRKYTGTTENLVNGIKKIQENNLPFIPTRGIGGVDNSGKPLGFAAPISSSFLDNVLKDIEQNKNQNPQKQNIKKFINPVTGDSTIFTREKLSKMDSDEFTKNEQAIFAQLNTLGIPSQKEVNKAVYNSSQDADGHWVTINGHHVLIKA